MINHYRVVLLGLLALGLFAISDAYAKGKGPGKGYSKSFHKHEFVKGKRGDLDVRGMRGHHRGKKGDVDIAGVRGHGKGNSRAFGQADHPGLHLGQRKGNNGLHLGHHNKLREKGEKGLRIGQLDEATLDDLINFNIGEINSVPIKEMLE